jgi:anaerobic selenocysteine-containing dehydrogenase
MILQNRVVRSSCRGCHGVCQVLVHLEEDRVVRITGDPDSPTSRGYLCPKGAAAAELLYHPDRLKYPLRRAGARGENKWERLSWAEGLYDREFVEKYTFGFDRLAEHVQPFAPEWAEPITRVPAGQIRSAARTLATTKPAAIQWGNGIDTSAFSPLSVSGIVVRVK